MADAEYVVPVFVFDERIYKGRHAGSNRNRFLLESLEDLKESLEKMGGDLVVREGSPITELRNLAKEIGATAIYYTADYSPMALQRDKKLQSDLEGSDIELRAFAGRLIVSSLNKIMTKAGTPHKVFTPFWKSWMEVGRREIAAAPKKLTLPNGMHPGDLPPIDALTIKDDLSPDVLKGGESEGLKRLEAFLKNDIDYYHDGNNDMAADRTSRLSSYLHFGCISPLDAESRLGDTHGARAWRRQLAWREFYHYVLFFNPSNSTKEFQEKYCGLKWNDDKKLLESWQNGRTGYPAVDAAMRQLNLEGWMHNRGRLIVGSFLTKDLWLDWRQGESYFMRMLIDGDQANNNGNWQWIASVGVDPAPVYRRLYNPSSQRDKFDPSGEYVRRYVPELKNVPDKYLSEPWSMPEDVQEESGCIIGRDYPAPIVNHAEARKAALENYRV